MTWVAQVKAGRELVGVPANQFIACVGVKGAKRASGGSDFAFMVKRIRFLNAQPLFDASLCRSYG
jgi:hypothetical protein